MLDKVKARKSLVSVMTAKSVIDLGVSLEDEAMVRHGVLRMLQATLEIGAATLGSELDQACEDFTHYLEEEV